MPLLLTIKQAAHEAQMSESFIKKEIREGRLKAGKFGRSRRILSDDLRAWAEKIVGSTPCLDESHTNCDLCYIAEKTVSAR